MESPARRSVFRLFDLLAPLGLLVIVAAFTWQRVTTRALPGQPRFYYLAGLGLILAHLVLRWDEVRGRVGGRQVRYGTNTAVLAVAVLAILVGLNWFANKRNPSWDLSKNRRHSLSDQTRQLLGGLKDDVTITYFERTQRMQEARSRLEQYASASSRVKVAFVDPVVEPGRAAEFDVTAVPTVVVQRGDRREKINNDSEQDLTNAVIKVTRSGRKTVCFVEGEGERDIDDTSPRGFSAARAALGESQYETRKVFLARDGVVPAECTVVALAGAEKDPLGPAVEALRVFVRGGGKALLLLEPDVRGATPSLTSLAEDWNIQVGKDVVADRSGFGRAVGGGVLTPVAMTYPFHEITKDLGDVPSVFHVARSVQAGTGGAPGIAAQSLVETFPDVSWAETNLDLKQLAFDEGADRRGPISLAAVATLSGTALSPLGAPAPSTAPAAPPVTLEGPVVAAPDAPLPPAASPSPFAGPSAAPEVAPSPSLTPSPSAPAAAPAPSPSPSPDEARREARVVVFGDADFASNSLLGVQGANLDLFLNAVSWLAQDPDLISIRPREPDDQRLFLTQQQLGNAWIFSIVLLPGLFLVLGVMSWWRRRG
jgi:ABC-type uncharacterized transport system involved in gliding motility auxiliary subunit